MATAVASLRFAGLYVDANAIAPETARDISGLFDRFVDGGIVGPPPEEPGDTRIYLSGDEADTVAELFHHTLFDARVIGGEPGAASALKMAYAGWTKGTTALLLALARFAEASGVLEVLESEWDHSIPGLTDRLERTAARIGRKAWRFQDEMSEIARSFRTAGLPPGFHQASAEIYRRLSALKGRRDAISVEGILRLLVIDEDG